MTNLTCQAELELKHLPDYLDRIVDRLASFEGSVEQNPERVDVRYVFGSAALHMRAPGLRLDVSSPSVDGLQRVRELVTVAVQIYAKEESPRIVWQGHLADTSDLVTFRKMRVEDVTTLTPHMRRVRLSGANLSRYGQFGGLHVRLLFPTRDVPDPVWPVAGANGLPLWPSEERKPVARVYTIRHLDADAGHMDIDFVVHGDGGNEGVGSAWAMTARPGDEIGLIGPLGRPLRQADWYVLGCDETGLPAASRILENLPANARGAAFLEVADAREKQVLRHPAGISVNWILRDGVPAGSHSALVEAVSAVEWPAGESSFGWFAAEAEAARQLRTLWRDERSLGRDQTLVAGYWRQGETGVMAG